MSEELKDKRPLEGETNTATSEIKPKQKRRRRNYDDYDKEVAKEEKNNKTIKDKKSNSKPNELGDSEESEVDDAKLDALVGSDEEEDDLAEIDTSNIITTGRRTRGKIIDYKKTAEELNNKDESKPKEEEEAEDADDDFKE